MFSPFMWSSIVAHIMRMFSNYTYINLRIDYRRPANLQLA